MCMWYMDVEHGLILFSLHLVTGLHEFLITTVNLHEFILAFLLIPNVWISLFRFPCRRSTGLAWSILVTRPGFWGGSGP